ncbi:hypothetical protein ACHQM5_026904 [Ranunculus cassubicifolius]
MSAEKVKACNVVDGTQMWKIEERSARNKRKFPSDSLNKHVNASLSDIQEFEFCAESFAKSLAHECYDFYNMCQCNKDGADGSELELAFPDPAELLEELESVQAIGEQEANDVHDADWSDFTESQLEELCLNNLDTIFKSAIKMICASGYSDDDATKAILSTDLSYGCKVTLSNIVDNTLAILQNEQGIDASRERLFENLEQLEKYILAEMVCVLREVNPVFNTGDAMWCLLICDMNVLHACAMDADSLSCLEGDETSEDSSSVSVAPPSNLKPKGSEENHPETGNSDTPVTSPCSSHSDSPAVKGIPELPNPTKSPSCEGRPTGKVSPTSTYAKKPLGVIEERGQGKSQASSSAEKLVGGRKSQLAGGKKESLRQKIQLEKSYRGSYRSGRFGGFSGLIMDKKMRSVSDSIGIHPKNAAMKIKRSMEVSLAHAQGDGHVSLTITSSSSSASNTKTVNTLSALPKTNNETSHSFQTTHSLDSLGSDFTTLCAVAAAEYCQHKKTSNPPPVLPKAKGKDNPSPSTKVNPTNVSSGAALSDSSHTMETANAPAVSAKAKPESSPSEPLKSNAASIAVTPREIMVPDFSLLGVSFDPNTGKWIANDKQDEVIIKLVARSQDMENQLGEWTDWANQKVIQATRRLNKDKAELKALKQEKEEVERVQKERQSSEDNSTRKLSELDNAFARATEQVKQADAAVTRLEKENSNLKKVMEEAKKKSAEATANFKEVSKREKKITNKIQSAENQRASLQDELTMLKRKRVQLTQEVEQAQKFLNQAQARLKQLKKEKEEVLMQADAITKQKLQIEATSKLEEDRIQTKAGNDLQRSKDKIRNLEFQILQLTLKTDPSKLAARQWNKDGSYAKAIKGSEQNSYLSKLNAVFQENLQTKNVKRDRECVMCLTEEMSVVFLPCAHQVVCVKCNEMHQKQGMKECPSCRTPIKRRISARFYRSTS